MSDVDKWFFGFITLWRCFEKALPAGTPDLLDATINRIGGYEACLEVGND